MSTLVAWREGIGPNPNRGTCVEVSRDKAATKARTLCGLYVTLPGPTSEGDPSCPVCARLSAVGEQKATRPPRKD